MKRSALFAVFGVLIFAIGCQQSSDQSASNTTPGTPADTTAGATTTTGTPPAAANPPAGTTTGATTTNAAGGSGYAAVQAIFDSSCMPCHSAQKHRSGLSLADYNGLMKGGDHGPAVVAGKPDQSLLIQYLTGKKKPRMPMNAPPLSDAQMKTISDWITAGAKNQ